jgi:hypothetical protein
MPAPPTRVAAAAAAVGRSTCRRPACASVPTGEIRVRGGNGGGIPANESCATTAPGGGGSGGAIHLASPELVVQGRLSAGGGDTGVGGTAFSAGSGGEGRIRLDGAPMPELAGGPTGDTPTTYEGPVLGYDGQVFRNDGSVGALLVVRDLSGAVISQTPMPVDEVVPVAEVGRRGLHGRSHRRRWRRHRVAVGRRHRLGQRR